MIEFQVYMYLYRCSFAVITQALTLSLSMVTLVLQIPSLH